MKQKKITVFNVVVFLALALFSLTLILFLLWGLMASVKEQFFDFRTNVLGFPKALYFKNYETVWNCIEQVVDCSYLELAFNTLVICLIASLCGTFFPCVVGYLVAKYPCKFSNVFYWVALVAMSLPIVGSFPSNWKCCVISEYIIRFSACFSKSQLI